MVDWRDFSKEMIGYTKVLENTLFSRMDPSGSAIV
jgi:hypothetical protein